MFVPDQQLKEAIEQKNSVKIYGFFNLIAYEDNSFSTSKFMDSLQYVKKQIPDIMMPYDEEAFKDKNDWNKDYWNHILFSLNYNFSEERINHLKEISAYLYPKTNVSGNSAPKNNAENKTATASSSSSNQGSDNKKNPTLAATAGTALMCVAALAINSKKIAAMAWLGALALGGYAVYTLLKKD